MNSDAFASDLPHSFEIPSDELLIWELRVAQRADELAQKTDRGREYDLENWLQAEREVLAPFTDSACVAVL